MIVQYEFSNKAKDIPPSEKSRTYPSIKEELKRKLDERKTPKRATHEVLKEKVALKKLPTVLKYLKLIKPMKYQEKEINHHKTLSKL